MYPAISHIDQILPTIVDFPHVRVYEKDGFTVINYVVDVPGTFDLDYDDMFPDAEGVMWPAGMFRRECRGIIFDPTGKLIRRPFHKFFNVGQREDTMPNVLDFSATHYRFEKMDGSMIAPFIVYNEILLGTKMGNTDIAKDAENWCAGADEGIADYLMKCYRKDATPIFEWVGPNNNIVIHYDESRLVFLAERDNYTGVYSYPDLDFMECATKHDMITEWDSHVSKVANDTNREGDILVWPDTGLYAKVKNEWYLAIHRAKDDIANDRKLTRVIIGNKLDDILPNLDSITRARVDKFEKEFWKKVLVRQHDIHMVFTKHINILGQDRKRWALEVCADLPANERGFIFSMLKGEMLLDCITKHVHNMCGNGKKYDELMEWLDG